MALTIQKATKTQRKLRMALMGPSGSGKTYTALVLAKVLAEGGKIVVIDTERSSSTLYSDIFDFDVISLPAFDPALYVEGIALAREAGAKVLIIDSLSHAWAGEGGVLDQVNAAAGNKFTDGWGKVGTPLQNRLVKSVLEAPMHVIATMRVKTEYAIEQNEKGKSVPKRVGLAAVQRDGVEYEFDIIGNLSIDNVLNIEKTRMTELTGKVFPKPSGSLAKDILAWLNSGKAVPVVDRDALTKEIIGIYQSMGKNEEALEAAKERLRLKTDSEIADILEDARTKAAEFGQRLVTYDAA